MRTRTLPCDIHQNPRFEAVAYLRATHTQVAYFRDLRSSAAWASAYLVTSRNYYNSRRPVAGSYGAEDVSLSHVAGDQTRKKVGGTFFHRVPP